VLRVLEGPVLSLWFSESEQTMTESEMRGYYAGELDGLKEALRCVEMEPSFPGPMPFDALLRAIRHPELSARAASEAMRDGIRKHLRRKIECVERNIAHDCR
jgi:hypothetical protein